MKYKGERAKAFLLIAVGLFLVTYLSVPATAIQPGGEINGVVTDTFFDVHAWRRDSNFIAGADIHLYSPDRVLQTRADAAGHFRLNNVPEGIYELEVAASGFKTKTIELLKLRGGSSLSYTVALGIANPGCSPLDSISYEPSAIDDPMVEGVVVDSGAAGGKPLAGVEVRLFHTSDKPTIHKTNERGEYRFNVDTPGRYFIQIVRPGYHAAQSQQFWITREGRTVVTMRQLKLGWLMVCE
jgi:hypothetical protein